MRQVDRTALVSYSPAEMFALVADIERYPQFVPWVARVDVLERKPDQVVARMHMERSGVKEKFTTRNVLVPPYRMDMHLVEGPFKSLEGCWTFEDIAGRGTRIGLSMSFEFTNPLLSMVLSRTFEKSCGQLVDAFVERAKAVHGHALHGAK
jgi:ribosome-associated toxin RatA of RatAB toxin-antitoxin module